MRIAILRLAGLFLSMASVLVAEGSAQDPATDGVEWRLFGSLGVTQFVGDWGEGDHASLGPTAQLGLQMPGSSAALEFSYWPDVDRFRLASLQLEFTQDLTSRRPLTPSLRAAVGHTWGNYLGAGPAVEPNGMSAAFGLGLMATVTARVSVGIDAGLRTDDGGWNGEARLLTEVASRRPLKPVTSRQTYLVSSWMTPLSGPWVSVSPAWGASVARNGGVLSLHLAHWQAPSANLLSGRWDTHAIIATVQGERHLIQERLRLRAGPAVTAMGEGPDNGVSVGGAVDFVLGVNVGSLRIDATAGWLWFDRDRDSDSSDQHGLMWSIALGI